MKKVKEIQIYIKDEETFLNTYYTENYKKLLVVDVHPTWSGPCEMMFPTYKALSTSIDDFEKRLDFIMLPQEKCKLHNRSEKEKDRFTATCRPKFLLILEGKILDEVNGANIPELTEKIYKNMPFYSS